MSEQQSIPLTLGAISLVLFVTSLIYFKIKH